MKSQSRLVNILIHAPQQTKGDLDLSGWTERLCPNCCLPYISEYNWLHHFKMMTLGYQTKLHVWWLEEPILTNHASLPTLLVKQNEETSEQPSGIATVIDSFVALKTIDKHSSLTGMLTFNLPWGSLPLCLSKYALCRIFWMNAFTLLNQYRSSKEPFPATNIAHQSLVASAYKEHSPSNAQSFHIKQLY